MVSVHNDNTKDVNKLITEKCLYELSSEILSCDDGNSLDRSLGNSRPHDGRLFELSAQTTRSLIIPDVPQHAVYASHRVVEAL